jgi:hypothetical protein
MTQALYAHMNNKKKEKYINTMLSIIREKPNQIRLNDKRNLLEPTTRSTE